jgi:putative mRNA 3-end processing factor
MVVYAPGRTSSYPQLPPERGLRYHYLGGGNEVGNVGIVLEDPNSNRLLLDYGIAPTKPPRYPNEAPHVSHAVITHSHIDHLGMVPWLASNHNSTLHGTKLTAAISEMMWYDCHKVSSIEGYPLPWDKRDIDLALSAWKTHKFNSPWTQGDWKLELHGAGHIPGAAMLHVETPNKSVLFSGDFDTRDSQLTTGAKPVKTDVLFVEGTYGGRDHPPKREENERFIERIVEIIDRGGTALVPAFANGRTQDVVMLLHKYLPELDVHVDGMGKRVAKLQMEHPETLRDPTALESSWKWCRRVSSKSDRKKALDADVIVSTSGMLDGGPSIWYLNRLRHDRKNAILLTGYQARNTGGRRLLEERRVPIFGKLANIELDVDQFSFSTHAGHNEIVQFAEECQAEDVVIYHSDPNTARPPLAEELEAKGHQVHVPENGISGQIE